MTDTDPLLTEEDRGLLLALHEAERDECSGCGHPLSVTTDPATMYTWLPQTNTCLACQVLEAQVENEAEHKRRGVKYAVIRTGAGV